MAGADDDYLLNLNSKNCPLFASAVDTNKDDLLKAVDDFKDYYEVTLAKMFGETTFDLA